MSYAVTSGLEVTYNSYEYSVKNGIYEIESGDDFVKVQYSLGKVEKEYVIPPVTTKEQFDAWTEKMDTDGKNLVQQYYKKYNINKLGKKDNKEELLADYPIIADEVIYVLRDTTKENVRKKMEERGTPLAKPSGCLTGECSGCSQAMHCLGKAASSVAEKKSDEKEV